MKHEQLAQAMTCWTMICWRKPGWLRLGKRSSHGRAGRQRLLPVWRWC